MSTPTDRRRIPSRFLDTSDAPVPVVLPPVAAPSGPNDLGGHQARRLVAGCMTGTSIDALDCALVAVEGHGLHLRATLVTHHREPLGELEEPLRKLAGQEPMTAGAIARLAHAFALLHLRAIRTLAGERRVDLVSVHGQTVFHQPPASWQLMNPAPLAHGLGVPVVCDLRAADLACGGQGAPLTPLADAVLLAHKRERRAVANLGGFCNLTRLPPGGDPDKVEGSDVCACNQLLDAVARACLGKPFDEHGDAAMVGTMRPGPFKALVRLLEEQRGAGRSLGTGDELQEWLGRSRTVEPADLARTACAAIAHTIVQASAGCDRLVLAGGGVMNRALMAELKERAGIPVQPSDTLGVPAAWREAMAWAVLGALSQDRVPVTLPQVTGVAKAPISGCWTLP